MGKTFKKPNLKKQHCIENKISLEEFLEFDPKNADEILEFQKYKLLYQLNDFMLGHGISKAELARHLGISRQAVTNKFLGETLTLDWIVRAFACLGIGLEIKKTPKARCHHHKCQEQVQDF